MNKSDELKVFISSRQSTKCEECGHDLGRHAWILLAGERGALCLACAELEHLAFLPSGDAALTRRAKKYSSRYAIVLKWSRTRKRYERQGLLVDEEALVHAEVECLEDEESRERIRERAAKRRAELDEQYVVKFANQIRRLYPGCPPDREQAIAEFACLKYSGRVGRSASAKQLDDEAVRLAVTAHIRHEETDYDLLLGHGTERHDAREQVWPQIERVLTKWERTR